MNTLEGKTALVTGASRGLGRAIALKLAALGADVAVNYSSSDEMAGEVMQAITGMGRKSMVVKASVTDSQAVKAMIHTITSEWGRLDILVNNAGVTRDMLLPRMSDDAWDTVLDTNLKGAFNCTKFALRPMMSQEWGRIICISSLAGISGNQGQANYSASKGGLIAFTKSVAREIGSRNITANVIAPGFITTDMTDRLPQNMKDAILERIPLKRFGNPDDVANLAAFLAGEDAGYLTAQVICIDGGIM